MDRDVFALMALVGLLPILVDSREKQLRKASTETEAKLSQQLE